jgi:hypothetical protein
MPTASLMFDDATIPAELKAIPHWVCWRAVPKGERIEKIPVCVSTGTLASSTNPNTWTDYASAAQQASMVDGLGLGFVFQQNAGIVGVDLDKCRNAETGTLEPWAEEIVNSLNTYGEVSPSGRGLHLYMRGVLPPGRRKKSKVEVYEDGRFFTVTGHHLAGTLTTIEPRTDELAAFHARYLADPAPERPASTMMRTTPLGDVEIVEKCRTARNAPKFEALWRGSTSGYASQSDADLALIGLLKFYTQDAGQLDRLFRQSGLMRDKWNERRGDQTYGERTIAEALAHVRETYTAHEAPAGSVSGMSVTHPEEWPEPAPIKTELLPVEPLPLGIMPAAFRPWAKDVSDRMQCPPDFVIAAMLVMTSSVIGAGCGMCPKEKDDWMVIPNLWGGVVGRPSMMKTPAISEAMKPLAALSAIAKREYDGKFKEHLAEVEAYKAQHETIAGHMRQAAKGKADTPSMDSLKYDLAHLEEPKPTVWRRYVTNDATIEKMAELQASNPRGLLLFRDELVGLFATWDKDGHEADRTFYMEGWNGDQSYTSDRIGRGTTHVENLCIAIFGGIQPAKLTIYLHSAMRGLNNDGLVQRLQVLVYPDELKTWKLIDRPIDAQARQAAFQAVERLATMDFRQVGAFAEEGQTPYFRFADDAQGVFNAWLTELEAKLRADEEPVLQEHLGKYRSLMPSLSLIFHLLAIAHCPTQTPCQVSKECALQAAAWCEYLESHARRIYGLVTNITAQAAAQLAKRLTKGELPDTFTAREVYRKGWSLLGDEESARNACEELVSLGWLREQVTPPAQGQKRKTEYSLNPKVRN